MDSEERIFEEYLSFFLFCFSEKGKGKGREGARRGRSKVI